MSAADVVLTLTALFVILALANMIDARAARWSLERREEFLEIVHSRRYGVITQDEAARRIAALAEAPRPWYVRLVRAVRG